MSYLKRLIDRATNRHLDLENNQIGNFRITPQHGVNVSIYHIYKINAKFLPTGRQYRNGHNQHVATIGITSLDINIDVNRNYLTKKEVSDIESILKDCYSYAKENITVNEI